MTAFLFTGLALGFLGSLHCVVMCGGIAGATSVALPPSRRSWPALLWQHAGFGLGRLSSYALAGALAGAIGAAVSLALGELGGVILRGVAASLLVAAGLYIGGWSLLITNIEHQGARLWRHVAPLAGRLRRGTSPWAALAFGALWGWLPCGLVYSALTLAGASGGMGSGAILMTGFGAGTLPAMIGVGVLADRFVRLARGGRARQLAGALMVGFAVWTFAASAALTGRRDGAGCHGARESEVGNPGPGAR
jgi:sulfite exporter TauE/SafE